MFGVVGFLTSEHERQTNEVELFCVVVLFHRFAYEFISALRRRLFLLLLQLAYSSRVYSSFLIVSHPHLRALGAPTHPPFCAAHKPDCLCGRQRHNEVHGVQ